MKRYLYLIPLLCIVFSLSSCTNTPLVVHTVECPRYVDIPIVSPPVSVKKQTVVESEDLKITVQQTQTK